MGRGLWRGLGTNAQITTPGRLGFRRGLLGGVFSPGVGRGYQDDMVGSHWPRQVAVWASRWPTAMCLKKYLFTINTHTSIHFLPQLLRLFYNDLYLIFKKKFSSNHNTKK
ncbi:hypothetical protein HanIR_Chr01g0037421 [Helianthus annuus]|nr:hypothetical protein HanIR_Chr01g0037421 [Helianthus annuus]